jgi:hypothetical protein
MFVLQLKQSVVDFPYRCLEFDPVSSQVGFVANEVSASSFVTLYNSQTANFSFINHPLIVLYIVSISTASLINQLKDENINYL